MMISPALSPSLSDCLRQIEESCPQWIARLDDLTQQILRRHSELRELSVRQLKKKTGSTESLIPRPNEADGDAAPANVTAEPAPISPNHYHHHQHLGRRKRKTETISSSMEPSKFRTRSMIIVYYDSAVQEAFESLVRNISSARNNLRKGRMALKMKQITAMSMADDDDDEDGVVPWAQSDTANGATPIISPRMLFARTPRSRSGGTAAGRMFGVAGGGMGSRGGDSGDKNNTPMDTMDQLLESAQSLSEHGAHQFLRDGDCSTEITGIKSRLAEAAEIAKREIQKLQAEEADGAGSEGSGEAMETEDEPKPSA